MLSVIADDSARAELHTDLDELAREGARRMLAAALEAEVDAYLAAYAAERDEGGRRLVVRKRPRPPAPGDHCGREHPRARAAGGRSPHRPDDRRADAVPVGGLAALVPQEPQGR
jgi:hypothetical protein